MKILGLKMASHDTGAALIADGKIVAIGEERLARVKYSEDIFPHQAIEYCLNALGVKAEEVDHIVTDWVGDQTGSSSLGWEELFVRETKGKFAKAKLHCIDHHDAHAATAFFCSPFREAAVLVYDGNGATFRNRLGVSVVETETIYRGSGTKLLPVAKTTHPRVGKELPFTWGIGKLYAYLSRFYLKMGAHNEGKMMGLSAYGSDALLQKFPIDRWCKWNNGELVCNSDITFPGATERPWYIPVFLHRLFLSSPFLRRLKLQWRILRYYRFTSLFFPIAVFPRIELPKPARTAATDPSRDPYYSSVAYAAQHIFEYFAISLAKHLRAITNEENLCVAGGCGLNIDANRKFITEAGFKGLFVQPASSDSGIALGCALWGWHVIAEQPRFWEMKSASLGRAYSDTEIRAALREKENDIEVQTVTNVAKETAKLVAKGNIVGWFQGGSEYGPRALGNRSIVCDPRGARMKEILNLRVKHRENWRPFAASVLRDKMSEWFDLEADSPFMLLMASVTNAKLGQLPAVTHVDGTCRLQTLTAKDNGLYWELVSEFDHLTGVPMVLNTSFNLAGEPIVETPADALRTFLATDFDVLVLGNHIVRKKGQIKAVKDS